MKHTQEKEIIMQPFIDLAVLLGSAFISILGLVLVFGFAIAFGGLLLGFFLFSFSFVKNLIRIKRGRHASQLSTETVAQLNERYNSLVEAYLHAELQANDSVRSLVLEDNEYAETVSSTFPEISAEMANLLESRKPNENAPYALSVKVTEAIGLWNQAMDLAESRSRNGRA